MPGKLMRFMTSSILAVSGAGCSTIEIHNAKIDKTSTIPFLSLTVIPDKEQATVVITKGIGLTIGQKSTSIGYMNETVVLIPDASACRAFIFIKDKTQLDELRHLLESHPKFTQLCTMTIGENP